ncbi:MAG: TIM barrel protein, partial [Planctomycetales bacterium]|nr:TIM barrel protein [Planctomycetales bacterium]
MKLGLINSAWVQANQPTRFGLQKTKELGFDTVDIFTDPLDIDIRERRLIKDECDRLELPIVSICCVAVGLIDFNPSVQRFHIERVQRYLDLAYEYQADNVLLVLGEYIWNREVIPPEEQWRTAVENCRRLGDYAASLGVRIALELEPFKLSLVNSVETMVRFLDDCDHEAVRATFWRRTASAVFDEDYARFVDYVGRAHTSQGADASIYIPERYVMGMVGFVQQRIGQALDAELHSVDPDLAFRAMRGWNALLMVLLELLSRV